jgi:flagellar basal-body rod modification protein FlgD
MSISPISQVMAQTASAIQTATASSTGTNSLDESDFMVMLVAQLKNQNPMEPMDDKALMGQVTQLNSLHELQAISAQLKTLAAASQTSYAASLIGKQVKTFKTGEEPVEGQVTAMEIIDGDVILTIGDKTALLSTVTEVKEAKYGRPNQV